MSSNPVIDFKMISKLEQLASRISDLQVTMEGFSSEMDLTTTNAHLNALQAIIADIDTMNTNIGAINSTALANIYNELQSVNSNLATTDAVIDSILSAISTIDGVIDTISANLADMLSNQEPVYRLYNESSTTTTSTSIALNLASLLSATYWYNGYKIENCTLSFNDYAPAETITHAFILINYHMVVSDFDWAIPLQITKNGYGAYLAVPAIFPLAYMAGTIYINTIQLRLRKSGSSGMDYTVHGWNVPLIGSVP